MENWRNTKSGPKPYVQAKETRRIGQEPAHPAIEHTYTLAQAFIKLLAGRQVDQLTAWMREALTNSLTPFHTLAAGLRRAFDAVQAALSLPWSNGQTEG